MIYKINYKCRLCSGKIKKILDLGKQPLANNFIKNSKQRKYPLNLCICLSCNFLQLREAFNTNFLFKNYSYYTPSRINFLSHYELILKKISRIKKLNSNSKVLEIGCNNGDFLDYIRYKKKCKIVGVDPAKNLAEHCRSKSIEIISGNFNQFLSKKIKKKYGTFDLIILRHVYAHIDNIKNVNQALKRLLSNKGIIYIENAYALKTLTRNEFDQIYHEHMSYVHLMPLIKFFNKFKVQIFDAFQSSIHGGSISLLISHANIYKKTKSLMKILKYEEIKFNQNLINQFIKNIKKNKNIFIKLIKNINKRKIKIGTYGASAKGSTLLNYYKLNSSHISKAFDNSENKINKFIPGLKIKITNTDSIEKFNCGYIIITAWNYLKIIIKKELNYLKQGGKFILPIPKIAIINYKNYKKFL
jgi:SAM-dependent methyltransferase